MNIAELAERPEAQPRRPWPWYAKAALLLGVCILLSVLEAASSFLGISLGGRTPSLLDLLKQTTPSWLIVGAMLPGIVWLSRRFPLVSPVRSGSERGRYAASVSVHVVAALLFPILHLALTVLCWSFIYQGRPMGRVFWGTFSVYYVMEVLTYLLIVGGYYAWAYYRKFRERELAAARLDVKTAQLQATLTEAKLQALNGQLNPHFLFNTLNAMSVLARQGRRGDVVRMISRLGGLLRRSLQQADQLVTLRDEIAFVRRYLEIERVRFRERLGVFWSVPRDCLDAEVPFLLLQPLVENAIVHGIAPSVGPGKVQIRARQHGDRLHITVRDTGPGMHSLIAPRDGIGLGNTRARLQQIYADDYELTLAPAEGGGTIAEVSIPFRMRPASRAYSPFEAAPAGA